MAYIFLTNNSGWHKDIVTLDWWAAVAKTITINPRLILVITGKLSITENSIEHSI